MRRASIVWFRSDLRCHDNEALLCASKESLALLPVYCFDPRDYGKSSSGFDKTGPYRARFLLECVSDLREKLRTLGSELLVRIGRPEEVLLDLARTIGAEAVYANQEVSSEELKCESKVSAAMAEEGIDAKFFWSSTLFHIEDLPFKLDGMPSTYSAFRESVRKLEVRKAMETPKKLAGLPSLGGVELGEIPTLQQLGLRPVPAQKQVFLSPSFFLCPS
jgi:deoxyribodipyrimidine photolyase